MKTEQKRLEYLNKELGTDYKSLEYLNKELGTDYKSLDEIDWKCISTYYNLSKDFLHEFQDRIDWKGFVKRKDIIDVVIKLIN